MSLKRLITLLLGILMLSSLAIVSAAPVAAGSIPSNCGYFDSALKVWSDVSYGGNGEVDCGYEANLGVRDDNFKNTNGEGTITGMEDWMGKDTTSSLKVFNESSSPTCVVLYVNSYQDGGRLAIYVGAGQEGNARVARIPRLNDLAVSPYDLQDLFTSAKQINVGGSTPWTDCRDLTNIWWVKDNYWNYYETGY
jgi:hypothetical protein